MCCNYRLAVVLCSFVWLSVCLASTFRSRVNNQEAILSARFSSAVGAEAWVLFVLHEKTSAVVTQSGSIMLKVCG